MVMLEGWVFLMSEVPLYDTRQLLSRTALKKHFPRARLTNLPGQWLQCQAKWLQHVPSHQSCMVPSALSCCCPQTEVTTGNRATGVPHIRQRTPLGLYRRPTPTCRVPGGSSGGGRFLLGEVLLYLAHKRLRPPPGTIIGA